MAPCCSSGRYARDVSGSLLAFEGELKLLHVQREVEWDLDRNLAGVLAVVDVHVGLQLKAIPDDLLAALRE
jgi:hypothetical protein